MINKILSPRRAGKNFIIFLEAIKNAQEGKSVLFVHPKGNVVIISESEYLKLTKSVE